MERKKIVERAIETANAQMEGWDKLYLPNDNNKPVVTRFEVIDEQGRRYTNNTCSIELSYQDGGKTLKVFVKSVKDGKSNT